MRLTPRLNPIDNFTLVIIILISAISFENGLAYYTKLQFTFLQIKSLPFLLILPGMGSNQRIFFSHTLPSSHCDYQGDSCG